MKQLFKYIIPAFIAGLAFISIAHAQVTVPSVVKKVGNNIVPAVGTAGITSSTILGSSTVNGAFNNLNISGTCTGCTGGLGSTTINGVTGPNYTFSIVSTSSPSSITTSSANVFLNLLKYTSSSQITISATGTIIFASNNISQFTNNVPYLTSSTAVTSVTGTAGQVNASAATGTVTLSLPQNINTTSSPTFGGETVNGNVTSTGLAVSGEVDFGPATSYPNLVFASTTSSGDYGTYLNGLCNTNASGSLIWILGGNYSFGSQVTESVRCTYEGIVGATNMTWTGAQGTSPFVMDFNAVPHTMGGGTYGITLINAGSATTTNPSIGVKASGGAVNTAGGAHGAIQWMTFVGWGKAIDVASGTYDIYIANNSYHANGYCVYVEPASNSGESITLGSKNWCVDPASGGTGGVYFATSSAENAWIDDLTIDNSQLQVNAGNQVFVSHLETENSGGAQGAYIPVIVANDPTAHLQIKGWQVHNDGTSTSTTYAALAQVDGNLSIDGLSVTKSVTASSTPILITTAAGSAGSENLTLCDVVNVSSAYTAMFGGAANNAVPTSTFNGCFYQYRANYAYSPSFELSNDNVVRTWNGNGLVAENYIPAGGTAGTSITCLGGGCTAGNASGTVQIIGANTSTLMLGNAGSANNSRGCFEVGTASGTHQTEYIFYDSANTQFITSTKPLFCQ